MNAPYKIGCQQRLFQTGYQAAMNGTSLCETLGHLLRRPVSPTEQSCRRFGMKL